MDKLLEELKKINCDVDGSLKRFVSSEQFYLKYLKIFPDDKAINNFYRAVDEKNYTQAEFEIHTYKGLTGNLGLTIVFDLAQTILSLLRNNSYENLPSYIEDLKKSHEKVVEIINHNK